MNPKTGAAIIGIGLFFLLLLNVNWGEIEGLVRAYAVLGLGMVCVGVFLASQGTGGQVSDTLMEVLHHAAGGIGAAIIVGSIFASLGGLPFWSWQWEGKAGERASRAFAYSEALTGSEAQLAFDLEAIDLWLVVWGNSEISVNGTIEAYAETRARADERLNQTMIELSRDNKKGMPAFTLRVDSPKAAPGRRAYKVNATIYVPASIRWDLRLDSATGKYELRSVKVAEGDLRIISGSVLLDGVTGDAMNVSVVSGSINAATSLREGRLSTVSGSVTVQLEEASGSYALKSTSGTIQVTVPSGDMVGYALKGRTTSGSVRYSLEGLQYSIDRNTRKEARTIDYDSKSTRIDLDMSTVSGSIVVEGSTS